MKIDSYKLTIKVAEIIKFALYFSKQITIEQGKTISDQELINLGFKEKTGEIKGVEMIIYWEKHVGEKQIRIYKDQWDKVMGIYSELSEDESPSSITLPVD